MARRQEFEDFENKFKVSKNVSCLNKHFIFNDR